MLQPVDMGNDLSKFSGEWLKSDIFLFCGLIDRYFAAILEALPFI